MALLAIVIPARMASVRFPGKPLVDLGGKPMLRWVYEACVAADLSARIVVATPDREILDAAGAFGAEAVLTRGDHLSGTDRLAEVAENLPADAYLNVQGDEPMLDPENIRRCASLMAESSIEMGSLFVAARPEEANNPAVVKVVTDRDGWALYFSRSLIPYPRVASSATVKKHLGIYAYRAGVLRRFTTWPVAPLEATEGLEQLRFLENGVRIRMALGVAGATAVDTPDQADEIRAILADAAAHAAKSYTNNVSK
ncbi:MAG: 3-deoxy-manno-octulosonate cytidylyltransferase [Fimbriimonadaceae bacterium]